MSADARISRVYAWALLACLCGLFSCDPAEGGARSRNGDGGGTSGTGAGGSTGTGGTAPTGGTGATGGTVTPDPEIPETPDDCEASVPGERLLRRLTRQELLNSQAAVFPEAAAAATTELPVDSQGQVRFTNDSETLMMGSQMVEAVLQRAEQIADVVTSPGSLSTSLPCAAQADAACAAQFIDQYGSALFRRPLEDTERPRYRALFDRVFARSNFQTALKWVLVSLIQSPHAVYRSELGRSGALTPHEIASELSYNYSAGPPSQALVDLAVSGGLSDPAARVAQAKQLLLTPAGKQVVQAFFSEWLSYAQAASANRANAPSNFTTIRAKMVLETERFLDDTVFGRQGSFGALFTANYTVADTDLAAYYGFSGGSGDLFNGGGSAVTRTTGLGIFAQGSVLTSMASVAITSPTRRGLLLLKRLYCRVPGVPEALNFDLTRSDLQGNTTRERLENSHLAASCQGCHVEFDPLGFAFEHFDHIGRYRMEEQTPTGSFPINATTTVALLDGQTVNGQEELVTLLAADPEVRSCVSATLERYVYGSDGRCRAKGARTKAMTTELPILDFLAELAGEPHFVSRP